MHTPALYWVVAQQLVEFVRDNTANCERYYKVLPIWLLQCWDWPVHQHAAIVDVYFHLNICKRSVRKSNSRIYGFPQAFPFSHFPFFFVFLCIPRSLSPADFLLVFREGCWVVYGYKEVRQKLCYQFISSIITYSYIALMTTHMLHTDSQICTKLRFYTPCSAPIIFCGSTCHIPKKCCCFWNTHTHTHTYFIHMHVYTDLFFLLILSLT